MELRQIPIITQTAFIPDTPAGGLALAVTQRGIVRIFFCNCKEYDAFLADHSLTENTIKMELMEEAVRELYEYFDGKRKHFDLPLDLRGQPPFRKKVLRACTKIPFGETISYRELAVQAGSPKAARAVGGAMACNPIAVVIPCHRVVGSDRSLHGYSSPGGISVKAFLLRHEGVIIEKNRVYTA